MEGSLPLLRRLAISSRLRLATYLDLTRRYLCGRSNVQSAAKRMAFFSTFSGSRYPAKGESARQALVVPFGRFYLVPVRERQRLQQFSIVEQGVPISSPCFFWNGFARRVVANPETQELIVMKKTAIGLLAGATLVLAACGSDPGGRALSGGLIGAGAGAAIGAATGGNPATGALIGGAVGAVGGAATSPCDVDLDARDGRRDCRR